MEGRVPTGIACVFVNLSDLSKEAEFNQWYENVHIPDVTNPGIFGNTTRYDNPGAAGDANSPRFFTIYETTHKEPAKAWSLNRQSPKRLNSGGFDGIEIVSRPVFERIGLEPAPANGNVTTGVLVVTSNCKDPGQEDEFNRWYDQVHIPDVLGTGHFYTASRFRNVNPDAGAAKFLAVYETADADPLAATAGMLEKMKPVRDLPGHTSELFERVFASPFRLIFSQARQGAASGAA